MQRRKTCGKLYRNTADTYLVFSISPVQIVYFADVVFVLVLFFAERVNPTKVVMWAMIFVVFPVGGFVLYLLIGQTFYSRHTFKTKWINDKELEEYTKGEIRFEKELSERNRAYAEIGRTAMAGGALFFTEGNETKLFTEGKDMFDSLFEDISKAERFVHLEYYIIRNDGLGNRFIDLLTEKVKQGVEVKLLTDDFGIGKGPKKNIVKYRMAGGEFASFHRIVTLLLSPKKNNRNHRKIACIDGKVGYCGGFNIGDEYLGMGNLGHWRDSAVRVVGPVIGGLELRFEMDWSYATHRQWKGIEKYLPAERPSEEGKCASVVSGGPDVATDNPVLLQYLDMIRRARRTIRIETPYLIPNDSLYHQLVLAADSGVDVSIIIPDKPDHLFTYWNNISNADRLMEKGIKVYKYHNGFVHAKTFVIDGEICSVGSANLDDRSMVFNFETNMLVLSKELGAELDAAFENDLTYCTEYSREEYRKERSRGRLRIAFSHLVSNLA